MPTPPDARSPARRDASMSLLTSLLNDTLDPGYAETAARRKVSGEGESERTGHWTRRFSPTVLFGVAALALVLVIAAIQTHRQAPTVEKERQQLISRVQDAERKNSADEAMISTVRGQLQQAQAEALGPEQGKAFTAMSVVTGSSPATGPGLQIVLGDAAGADAPAASGDPRQQSTDQSRVLDLDLQNTANGLWAAGAEAIAINGQRLTPLSAIRTAGSAIMVDFRPLSSPYTIQAIGDPKSLSAKFADGADGRYLFQLKSQYGIRFETSTKSKLSLPAATQLTLTDAVPAP